MPRALLIVLCGCIAAAAACGSESPVAPTVSIVTKLPPVVESPADGEAAGTFRPTLVVRNGTSDQAGARLYEFQISDSSGFSTFVARQAGIAEDSSGMTS